MSEGRNRKSRWLALLALLLLVSASYGTYRLVRTDPNLRKVREMREELFASNRTDMTPEEREEKRRQLREAMEKLSQEQRDKLRDESAKERIKRQEAEMKRYALLSEQEKQQYLDEQIRRQEEARQRREAAQQGQPSGSTNGGRNGARSSNAPTAPKTDSNGTTEPSTARPVPTPEDRDARRKLRLDLTTPDFRAARDNYFADLRARRQQLGLPAGSGFGRP